jgi:hypothetical protein
MAHRIKALDFGPVSGSSYDLDWPGPPRRPPRYTDVKHYRPVIELEAPATEPIYQGFWVKEARRFWPDPTLGSFNSRFDVGSTTPAEIATVNYGVGGDPPSGAPQRTVGSFWLTATQRGKIRGNEGKGDDGHARVYLEAFAYGGSNPPKSSTHTVRATG